MRIQYAILIFIFLAVISLPYLFAWQGAGPDHVFGGFLINPLDGNSYLAKMYQGWRGDWQFTLPYTADVGQGAYLFLFYIFLGHIARWTGLSLILVFHLARMLSAIILCLALLRFLKSLNLPEGWRRWTFALALFGSGLGWLAVPFGAFTSDLWVAETYPFLSSYANAHFTIGLAMIVWLLTLSGAAESPRSGLISIFLALALSIIAPFGVLIVCVVLGGMLIEHFVSKRQPDADWLTLLRSLPLEGKRLLWVVIGGAPFLLYDLYVVWKDPVLAGWNAQNLTPSPPLWDLIVSLSPVLLVGCIGAAAAWKRKSQNDRMLSIWLASGLLLMYVPFGLQRRMMMGLYIPLACLAGLGMAWLALSRQKLARLLAVLMLVFPLPTNLLVLLAAQHGVQTRDPALYLSRGEAQALEWIAQNTPEQALILASPEMGLFIPAYTGRRVIYGHPFETVKASFEQDWVLGIYRNASTLDGVTSSKYYLVDRGMEYVFWGPRESELGEKLLLDNLNPVYFSQGVAIYQVRP